MSSRLIRLMTAATIVLTMLVPAMNRVYAADTGTWHGEYFTITDPAAPGATPALVREDPKIDFDWGASSPDPAIPIDNFSVRWSRTLTLAAGTYRFATFTDDGVRLKIDGTTVIDHFSPQSATYYEYDAILTTGSHAIVLEYFEGYGDALAKLSWARHASDGVVRINAGGGGY